MLSRAQNNDGDDKKQAPALQKLRGQQGPPQVICSRVFRAPRALGATLGNAEVASQTPEGVLRKPGSIIEAWSASSDEAEPARKVKIETETAWEPQALKVDLMRDMKGLRDKLHDDEQTEQMLWKMHQQKELQDQKREHSNRYQVEKQDQRRMQLVQEQGKKKALADDQAMQVEEDQNKGFSDMKQNARESLTRFVGEEKRWEDENYAGTRQTRVNSAGSEHTQTSGRSDVGETDLQGSVPTTPKAKKYSIGKGPAGMRIARQSPMESKAVMRGQRQSKKLPPAELEKISAGFREAVSMIPELGVDDRSRTTAMSIPEGQSEELQVRMICSRVFRTFAVSHGEDENGKHSNSMGVSEYLTCMEGIKLLPHAISKSFATALFKEVNSMHLSDYDSHEMSLYEFQRSIEIVSKRIGFLEVAELMFTSEERQKLDPRAGRGLNDEFDGLALAGMQGLGDLRLEHMRALLKIFKTLSSETALEPELPMSTFVEAFTPVLKLSESEVAMLFMKIDVNSDGIVSWNEFSSFVLDMHTKGGSIAHGDTVFDGTRFEEKDVDLHHEDSIGFMRHMKAHNMFVSCGQDGVLKTWHASTGLSHSKTTAKTLHAVPSGTSVMSMMILARSNMLAVGSDDFKIRFYDGATLKQELTYDTNQRWPMSMGVFEFPEDTKEGADSVTKGEAAFEREKRELAPWFCWGDNTGEVHFVPEFQLMALRTHLEVVPFFKSSLRGTWGLRVFPTNDSSLQTWCTQIAFVRDVGVNGVVVVACSTGSIAVVSVESRYVFHYFHQHRLSVKALEWCSRQNNLMASAGLDRDIHLWRPMPLKNGKPIYTGSLNGHKARVMSLAFHEARDVLFSLDSHSVVLVWDLASRTLVCRLQPLSGNPFDINHKVVDILVNLNTRHLVTSTNHPRLWGVRALDLRDESERLLAHTNAVVSCIYNTSFDHLLTADSAGLISLWQVTTGRQFFKFLCEEVEATHRASTVTCAAFDESERRLLVGWSQGSVQVYNFSNGTLLHNLVGETTAAVTALTHAAYTKGRGDYRHLLLASYDDGVVLQWISKLKGIYVEAARHMETPAWMGADLVDIPYTAMAFTWPTTLFVGRKDGLVMLWDMQTGFLLKNDKGAMALQVTKNKSISLRAVRFLHKVPHVCVAADESGNVHFIDTMKCEKAGMFSAEGFGLSRNSLSSPANGDGISAVEIDDTDSFLVAGDCNGFIQVWDISQVCADGVLDTSLRIELFRWKAHREEVSQITYIPKHNLMMTASREIRYPAMLWTVTGVQIGILGHARWTSDVLVEKTACLSAAGGDRSSLSEPVKSSPRLGGGFIARLQEAGPSRLQKLGLLQGAAGVLVQEGANQRQRNLTEMAAQLEKEAQRLAEEDKVPRGQLTVTVQSVLQMPHSDEGSRVDPYCCVKLEGHPERRTRTIENMSDAAFNEHFLYFVEGLSVELTVEVWDYDPGGDQLHDFIGQISGRVDDLFMGGHRIDLSMQLTNKDGSNPGTLGHIELRLEFDAVTSELDVRDRPRNLQDTIKQVLSKHRQDAFIATTPHHVIDHGTVSEKHDESFFVPLPLKHTGVGYAEISNVTSLATARWDTSDFRNLAVYRLQDDRVMSQKISGAQTERLDRRRKKLDEDRQATKTPHSSHGHRPPLESHKFTRDTHTGKLERSLDGQYVQAFGDGLLSTLDANTALERFNRNAAASSHTRRSGSDGDRLGSGPVSRLPLNKTLAAGQKFGTVIRLMHIPRRQEEEHRLAEQMATRQGRRSNMGLDLSNPSHLNMEIQAGQHSKILAGGIKLLRRYPAGEGATAVGNALPKLKISR